tara:strand:- start:120 stop:374 length:255 start_codon:yes stop_codon:yes gene_type:complete
MQEENIIPVPTPAINLKVVSRIRSSKYGVTKVVMPTGIDPNANALHNPNFVIKYGDNIVPIIAAKVEKETTFPTIESEYPISLR